MMTDERHDNVPDTPMPARVAALPRDNRGFPIPAHVGRRPGRPVRLSELDFSRLAVISLSRRCTICGHPVDERELCWFPSSAAWVRASERNGWAQWDRAIEGAGHLDCMLYATIVCPFLREPGYERRTTQRSGGEVITAKGVPREAILLAGYPEMRAVLVPAPSGSPVFETFLGGGQPELIEFTHGDELLPALRTSMLTQPDVTSDAVVQTLTNEDGPELAHLVWEATVEIAPRSGLTIRRPPRNEPCPCGRGRKYKHCCAARVEAGRRLPVYDWPPLPPRVNSPTTDHYG